MGERVGSYKSYKKNKHIDDFIDNKEEEKEEDDDDD